MKLKFFCGLILLALTFGARAQFTSNSISGISPSSAFGTNAPGAVVVTGGIDLFQIVVSGGGSSVTTNNVYYYGGASGFYTNTLGTNITYLVTSNALAALGYPSNKFAAICFPPVGTNLNLLYTNTANNLISTNWVKAATAGTNPAPTTAYQTFAGTFFGGHGSVAGGTAFGTNAPGYRTNGAVFSGSVGRIYSVTTNLLGVWVTNSDSWLNGLYVPTNNCPAWFTVLSQNWLVKSDGSSNGIALNGNNPLYWFIGTNPPAGGISPNRCNYYINDEDYSGNPYPPVGATWQAGPPYFSETNPPTVTPVFSYTTNYP